MSSMLSLHVALDWCLCRCWYYRECGRHDGSSCSGWCSCSEVDVKPEGRGRGFEFRLRDSAEIAGLR